MALVHLGLNPVATVRRLRRGAGAVVDLVFPPRCACCNAELAATSGPLLVCATCREQLVGARSIRCVRCGEVTAAASNPANPCAACRGARLRFDSVVPLADYRGTLRQVVLRMKQRGNEALSMAMGDLLHAERETELAAFAAEVIVPMPMHWSRRLLRGANSPELVAAALSNRLRIPLLTGGLLRRRNTRQQGSLLRSQRAENIRGAFGLSAGYDFSAARVLLVDDVMTTGATCSEAAATLRRGGAAHVGVAVLGRAGSAV